MGSEGKASRSVIENAGRSIQKEGHEVLKKSVIPVPPTNRKPDLVVWKRHEHIATVIDAQVVADSNVAVNNACHRAKVVKYDTAPIRSWLKSRTTAIMVRIMSAACNWRGCWLTRLVEHLRHLGLSLSDAKLIAVRCLAPTVWMVRMRWRTMGSLWSCHP